jgi:hypothetical protein
MKNLKYIQIFEAFESKILSKTLGYIETSDRSTFMDKLKRLCRSIDFPLSKMSDEYFEYLPFKSALSRAAMTGDEPCEATSKSEFPDYAVAGEKCTNGKIKRTWGARTRDVVCPICGGSGVKPKKSEVKLVKFWFTSEGKFVANTLVDGMVRTGRGSGRSSRFSTILSDYTVGKAISGSDLNTLSGGEMAVMTIASEDNVIAYIFKEGNRYYAIQDKHSGSTPSSNNWKNYGRYSWALGASEYSNMRLLTQKVEVKNEEEVDPYSWNTGIDFGYGGIKANTSSDVQSQIKDAHFAIVFDFGKLRKSEFETTQDTKSGREERKEGSKLDPNQSDEAIKKKNIERYVNLLSQKLDISADIANCNRLITRSLGHKGALYIVYGTNIYSGLGNIIDYYIKFMSATNDRDKKMYAEEITDRTNDLFKNGMRKADVASDTIKNLKARIKSSRNEESYLQVLDLTQKLSDAIYDNLKNFQINDIEDLEVVAQKISSIRNVLKSDRYGLSRYFGYVVEYISSGREDRAYNYLNDSYYTNVDEILEKLPRMITIISKI